MAAPVIRVGIAGQGRSGFDIHAAWLRQVPDQYRIVAVADQLEERRAEAAAAFGCRTYDDYKGLIADREVDVFVNALPSFLHPQATIEALRAGKHVVCEKPIAVRVKDIDRMIRAAEKAGRILAPFQNSRFSPAFMKLQEVIASGVLGRIIHIRINVSNFARRWDWQTRQQYWGGNLNNTGPHPLDQAIMLFGPEEPRVFCRMGCFNPFGGDADDFCAVTLYGENSPTVEVLISSYQAYPQGDQYSVSGTYGGLAGGSDGLRWRYFDPAEAPSHELLPGWSDKRQYCREDLPWREEKWTPPKEQIGLFHVCSRAFYNNLYDVLVNNRALVVTPAQVRRQVAVIERCHSLNPLPVREQH